MQQSNMLTEGLVSGDLVDLVLPLISIDEYISKIDEVGNIVIAFFINDEEPAQDLARFISKSYVDIFDVEISKIPNEDDFYLVFVEMTRDKHLFQNVIELSISLKALTEIEDWKFKAYRQRIADLTEENLKDAIELNPSLSDILKDTNNVEEVEESIKAGSVWLKVVEYTNSEKMQITEGMNFKLTETTNRIQSAFGYGWAVDAFGDHIYATHPGLNMTLKLKLI